MYEISFLESDQDLDQLIPLVKMFSKSTRVSFWQQLAEVTATYANPGIFVLLGKDSGRIVGYLCGYFLNQREFYVSQLFSPSSDLTQAIHDFLVKELQKRKVGKILALSKHDPRWLEKYGFKMERILMSKQLEDKEEVQP